MPRVQTKGIVGEYFHIYNRGVDKRKVFLDKEDYLRFYESLYYFNSCSPVVNLSFAKIQDYRNVEHLVEVVAYCLLPNHFHLVLKQTSDNGIGEYMRRVGTGYTSYFNEKYNRSGALFQGVYKRTLIDSDKYLQYLLAYVNENHHVHKITQPLEIVYSSSLYYRGSCNSKVITEPLKDDYNHMQSVELAMSIYSKRAEYKEYLLEI